MILLFCIFLGMLFSLVVCAIVFRYDSNGAEKYHIQTINSFVATNQNDYTHQDLCEKKDIATISDDMKNNLPPILVESKTIMNSQSSLGNNICLDSKSVDIDIIGENYSWETEYSSMLAKNE